MSQILNFKVDGLRVELPKARKDYSCQYPGREFPQDAYLQLRMSAEPPHLCATFNGEVGPAVPEDVYHGHTLRFDFPCTALLKDVRGPCGRSRQCAPNWPVATTPASTGRAWWACTTTPCATRFRRR